MRTIDIIILLIIGYVVYLLTQEKQTKKVNKFKSIQIIKNLI